MTKKFEKSLNSFKIKFDKKINNYFNLIIEDQKNEYLKETYVHLKNYILSGGKRLRPYILYKINKEQIKLKNIYNILLAFEFLHNSTLIDDDIIDEHYKRRNKLTLPSIYNNKKHKGYFIALLSSNILRSLGINLIINSKLPVSLKEEFILAYEDIGKSIDSAQILDIKYRLRSDIDEKTYLKQSKQVTAKFISYMFSLCAYKENKSDFFKLGEYLGMSFQLTDDLMDINYKKKKGRLLGSDIKEGTQTLLTIYSNNKFSSVDKKKYFKLFGSKSLSKKDIKWIISKYNYYGVITDVNSIIINYINKIKIISKKLNLPSTHWIISISKYCYERKN